MILASESFLVGSSYLRQTRSDLGVVSPVNLNYDTKETSNFYHYTYDAPQSYSYEPAVCSRNQRETRGKPGEGLMANTKNSAKRS